MIEPLILNSVFLNDAQKQVLLFKVKNGTPKYRQQIEQVFLGEAKIVEQLISDYASKNGEVALIKLKGIMSKITMQQIREDEKNSDSENVENILSQW